MRGSLLLFFAAIVATTLVQGKAPSDPCPINRRPFEVTSKQPQSMRSPGSAVRVADANGLRKAVASSVAGTWIILDKGEYVLTEALVVAAPNVTISSRATIELGSWSYPSTSSSAVDATLACSGDLGTAIETRAPGVTLHGLAFAGCSNSSVQVSNNVLKGMLASPSFTNQPYQTIISSCSFQQNSGNSTEGTGAAVTIINSFVVLDNVVVSNNNASSAITSINSSVLLQHSTLESNGGPDIACGGALYALNGNVMLHNVTVSGNSALSGGGLCFDYTRDAHHPPAHWIHACVLTNNTADNTLGVPAYDGFGGAVFSGTRQVLGLQLDACDTVPQLTITSSVLEANAAAGVQPNGGALFIAKVLTVVDNCTFAGNSANGPDGLGGAVHALDGVVNIASSTFTQHYATTAGGTLSLSAGPWGSLWLTSSSVTNSSGRSGSAVYVEYGVPEYNQSNPAAVHISHTVLDRNVGSDGTVYFVVNDPSSLAVFDNVTFSNNKGSYGAGIVAESGGVLRIQRSSFVGNNVSSDGAGLYAGADSNITAVNCSFIDNHAQGSGGGVYALESAVVMSSVLLVNNSAAQDGGAAFVTDPTAVAVTNCTAADNTAAVGGAFYVASTEQVIMRLTNSTLFRNTAGAGGAVYANGAVLLNATDTAFVLNKASLSGGAVSLVESAAALSTCKAFNNSAGSGFGGFTSAHNSTVRLFRSVLRYNKAATGGAVAISEGSWSLEDVTLAGNSASVGGAAALFNLDSAEISNSSFVANSATVAGALLAYNTPLAATTTSFINNSADGNPSSSSTIHGLQSQPGGSCGALLLSGCEQASLQGCALVGNRAASSGGAACLADGLLDTMSTFFTGNQAGGSGGAVALLGYGNTTLQARDSTFGLNSAAMDGGAVSSTGAEEASAAQYVVLEGCQLDSNAAGGNGGGCAVGERTSFTAEAVDYLNNSAAGFGGAVSCVDCSGFAASSSNITGNTASGGGGLAFLLRSPNSLQRTSTKDYSISSCQLSNNTATPASDQHQALPAAGHIGYGRGGALLVASNSSSNSSSSRLTITGSDMLSNTASRDGGAMALQTGPSSAVQILLDTVVLQRNRAVEGAGGALYASDPSSVFVVTSGGFNSTPAVPIASVAALKQAAQGNNTAVHAPGFASDPYKISYSWQGDTEDVSAATLLSANVTVQDYFDTVYEDDAAEPMTVSALAYEKGSSAPRPEAVAGISKVSVRNGVAAFRDIRVRGRPGRQYGVTFQGTFGSQPLVSKTEDTVVTLRQCTSGEYSASDGCVQCRAPDYVFDPTADRCNRCPTKVATCGGTTLLPLSGYWHSHPRSDQVLRCLNQQSCQRDVHVSSQMQAWLDAHNNVTARDMPSSDVAAYMDLQCAPGYAGTLCNQCNYTSAQPKYGMSNHKCYTCSDKSVLWWLACRVLDMVVIVVVIKLALGDAKEHVVTLSLASTRDPRRSEHAAPEAAIEVDDPSSITSLVKPPPEALPSYRSITMRSRRGRVHTQTVVNALTEEGLTTTAVVDILTQYMQLMGILRFANIEVTLSDTVSKLFQVYTATPTSTKEWVSLDCVLPRLTTPGSMAILRTTVNLLLPVAYFLLVVGFYMLKGLLHKLRADPGRNMQWFRLKVLAALIAVTQLFYPAVASTSLSLFACRPIDNDSSTPGAVSPLTARYWMEDLDLQCYQGHFKVFQWALGAPIIALVVVGYPTVLLALLLVKRARMNTLKVAQSEFWAGVGFVHADFRNQWMFWAAIPSLQQGLMLVFTVSFLQARTQAVPMLACTALATVFLGMQLTVRPYLAHTANRLATVTLLTVQASFLLLTYHQLARLQGTASLAVQGLVAAANVGALLYILYHLWVLGVRQLRQLVHGSTDSRVSASDMLAFALGKVRAALFS